MGISTNVSSLKDLCKKKAFEHPEALNHSKLIFDDPKDSIKKVFSEALFYDENGVILETLRNATLIELKFDEKQFTHGKCIKDKCEIILGKSKKEYYFTKASKKDIPKNFQLYFADVNLNLKRVGMRNTLDSILIHEFYHLNNFFIEPDFWHYLKTPSWNEDMHNLEEERTILEGENPYLKNCGKPKRVDHMGCDYPSYLEMLDKSKDEQKKAFIDYLKNGACLDVLKLNEQFKNKEIEELLEVFASGENCIYQGFIELILSLIIERQLDINFSNPRWYNLYNHCLINTSTIDQFHELQKFKNESDRVYVDSLSNIRDKDGNTLMHLQIEQGSEQKAIKLLLDITPEELANFLNIKNKFGKTIIYSAYKKEYFTLLDRILEIKNIKLELCLILLKESALKCKQIVRKALPYLILTAGIGTAAYHSYLNTQQEEDF